MLRGCRHGQVGRASVSQSQLVHYGATVATVMCLDVERVQSDILRDWKSQRGRHVWNRTLLPKDGACTVRDNLESESVVTTHNQGVVLERCLVSNYVLSILNRSGS